MKKIYKILLIFLLIMALTSCGSDKKVSKENISQGQPNQENSQKSEYKSVVGTKQEKSEDETEKFEKKDLSKVIEDLLNASSLLKSFHSQSIFTINNNDVVRTQVFEGEGEFDPKTGEVLNGKYQITNNDGTYKKVEFVGDIDKTMKLEEKDSGGNITTTVENNVNYFINPNYFDLVKVIDSMKDDLVLEDSESSYKLSLKSNNTDIFGLFKDQYSLEFNNFTQDETKKEFEVIIDKKTNLLTDIKFSFELNDDVKGHVFLGIESGYNNFEFKN